MGGFDEYYAPFSWEEVDFCTAVRSHGMRCYAVAGVSHEHEFGVSRPAPALAASALGRAVSECLADSPPQSPTLPAQMGHFRPGRAVRKAIVSLGTGPQRILLRIARTTIVPYARRHGYALHLHEETLDDRRPAAWSKIVALQELQSHYDVLVWLDADLMIVDGRPDIASELEEGQFLHLVEHITTEGRMPNSGVMLLRTGEHCHEFLQQVWDQEDLVEHTWWENAAICRLLGYELDPPRPTTSTPWLKRTKFLSGQWNSIHDARSARAADPPLPGVRPSDPQGLYGPRPRGGRTPAPRRPRMKIGVDARAAREEPAGRGTVVRELLRAWSESETAHEFLLYAREPWLDIPDDRFCPGGSPVPPTPSGIFTRRAAQAGNATSSSPAIAT